MSTMTSECLLAAGINKVVWIDDFFAAPSHDELVTAIHACIAKLKDSQVTTIESGHFSGMLLTQTKAAVESACDDIIERMSDDQLGEALKQLVSISGMKEPTFKSQVDDFTPEEFNALRIAFGNGLTTFCLGTWTSSGAAQYTTVSNNTLFIIDKEYKRESANFDGTSILADLTEKTDAFCILLTHTYVEAEQEERRKEIANIIQRSAHKFCILSKRQTPELEIDAKFARAIRTVMTHRFNGDIAFTISKTIQSTADETASALTAQSVSDLERVLFENADDEGVFEYDAVLRIFEIQQRHALNAALAKEGVQRQLQLSRKFREATEGLEIKSVSLDMGYFRDIRAREMFFEGTGLNKLHSPLSCGDVFQAESGERYVLLAQPCDLMVRKDGERRAEVGFLALISDSNESDTKEEERKSIPDYRFYDLKDVFGKDKKSIVNFQKMFAANLAVLDLAAFNSDGSVQLQREQPAPSIILSRGWDIALKNAKRRIFWRANKPPKEPSIGIGSRATNLAGVVSGDKNQIRYPLRRIGRLQSVTATAILAAWATFQTRAAFDHDFAKEKDSKPSASGRLAIANSAADESTASLKNESAIRAQTDPATMHAAESATVTKNDAQVNAGPQLGSSASASPPSIGLASRPRD